MSFLVTATDASISVLLLLISYLIGSIPNGIVLGKLICHKDIREHGSQNIGSTNAIRVLGRRVGFLVLILDVLKGMFIILIIKEILQKFNIWTSPINLVWYGISAVLGHVYSIYLGFKGGKAVATSLGVLIVLCPLSALTCIITFGIFVFFTGYVSVGSTAAAIVAVITCWVLRFLNYTGDNWFLNFLFSKKDLILCIIISFMGLLILIKHKSNYKRLIQGTENSFKKSTK